MSKYQGYWRLEATWTNGHSVTEIHTQYMAKHYKRQYELSGATVNLYKVLGNILVNQRKISDTFILFEDDGLILHSSDTYTPGDKPILLQGTLKECQDMFDNWLKSQQ